MCRLSESVPADPHVGQGHPEDRHHHPLWVVRVFVYAVRANKCCSVVPAFCHLPFVFTYLDDHLIASRTLEEHLLHLQQFFQVLQENGLTINPHVFAVPSLKFLSHMVDEAGVTPVPRHVAAVQDCLPLTDIKQLQHFLGLINFYRRFLPAVARTLHPLTNLLKGSPKVLLWSPAADAAFAAAKAALVAAVPLCHPAPNAVLSLSVDASDSHVGGVLQQRVGNGWKPLVFFSKKCLPQR